MVSGSSTQVQRPFCAQIGDFDGKVIGGNDGGDKCKSQVRRARAAAHVAQFNTPTDRLWQLRAI